MKRRFAASCPRIPISSAASGLDKSLRTPSAIARGSSGSTSSPQLAPSMISRHNGKSDATTGSPAAMYSNIFMGSDTTYAVVGCERTNPIREEPSNSRTPSRSSRPQADTLADGSCTSSSPARVSGENRPAKTTSTEGNSPASNLVAATISRAPRWFVMAPTYATRRGRSRYGMVSAEEASSGRMGKFGSSSTLDPGWRSAISGVAATTASSREVTRGSTQDTARDASARSRRGITLSQGLARLNPHEHRR